MSALLSHIKAFRMLAEAVAAFSAGEGATVVNTLVRQANAYRSAAAALEDLAREEASGGG